MLVHIPDHFSSKFKFDFSKTPTSKTDRNSLSKSVLGFILGFSMLGLGIFEMLTFIAAEQKGGQSFMMVEVFAFIIILIALGLIIGSILSLIRYKKFYFDGDNFNIIYRPSIGVKHKLTESINNYVGVRLRVLFTQVGIFAKNRYIIDLYHEDASKIIPLYISTQNKDIRNIWENYARLFKLPALSIGERGLVKRDYEDLNKSIKELYIENKLPFIASGKIPSPSSLLIEEKDNSIFITPKEVYWDTFSSLFLFISTTAMLLLVMGGIYITFNGSSVPLKYWILGGVSLFAIIYFIIKLFSSYCIDIRDNKVFVQDIVLGSIIKEDFIDANKIENVELSYNPIIDRYTLALISDDKVLTFGNRLPVNDLLWLKDFIIRKLVGN
ncbi:MAG: hypothetical protein IKW58_02270 [Alphaproteobacteria bacterium]|nr:hypothetical protein [Alphaproteobacteria bacterium]